MTSLRIGPGTLVPIVGPSGAGKDTLISLASRACGKNSTIVFPRRVVTRPSSDAESHDSLTTAGFDDAVARGLFAFWWEAHGHCYGIPKAIDAELEAGHVVVCNVSRTAIGSLRERYDNVVPVLITASPEILAGRLKGRARESDGPIEQRIARNSRFGDLQTAAVIDNGGSAEIAAAHLIDLLRNLAGGDRR